MIGGVWFQVIDPQLGGCLLNGAGLFDQGGNGITDDLVTGSVVCGDELVVVFAFGGMVNDDLQFCLGGFQVGLESSVGCWIGLGYQR